MAQPIRLEPDLQFIAEVQAVGGESLKKCYQCATCSVVCPISPDSNPFPRKEMIWAQWGLKDRLLNNVDIWLCHNCGTCSDMCPRGAKPGDLLAALRNMAYRNLMAPKIIGEWMSSAKGLPFLIAIPAIIYLVIWFIRAGMLGTAFPVTPEGDIVYSLLFPEEFTIDPIFVTVAGLVAFTFYKGVSRLISSFAPQGSVMMLGEKKHWIRCLIDVIKDEILTHSKFRDCGADKSDRKLGHLSLFYGFIALFLVTSYLATGYWGGMLIGHPLHTPLPFSNPMKILANVGAILLIVGLTLLTGRRLRQDEKMSTSSYYDWYLLGVIWVIGLTGILAEVTRVFGLKYVAYPVYFLHLVAVFMMIAYLPWSKLGHLVYRTAALTYARYMGRKTV